MTYSPFEGALIRYKISHLKFINDNAVSLKAMMQFNVDGGPTYTPKAEIAKHVRYCYKLIL